MPGALLDGDGRTAYNEGVWRSCQAFAEKWNRRRKVLQLTAVIEREGEGYVATCPEVDVVSQGNTVEEARLNLLEAVEGFFKAASPSEIRRRLKKQTYKHLLADCFA
jgi:predicted RNase H-like HicB family nuclease